MIKDPDPASMEYQLLLLYLFGRETLIAIENGKQPPPDNIVELALNKAKEHFQTATQALTFSKIVVNMADCRELLCTLRATFKNIGVGPEQINEVEKRMQRFKTKKCSEPELSGRTPESHMEVCKKGNRRLLEADSSSTK